MKAIVSLVVFTAAISGAAAASLIVPQNATDPLDNTPPFDDLSLASRANGFDCGDLRDYSYFVAVKTSESALADPVRKAVSEVLKQLPKGQFAKTQAQNTQEKNGYLVQAAFSNVASDAVRTDIIRDALSHLRDSTVNVGKGKRIPANSVAWYTADYVTDGIGGVATIRTLKRNPGVKVRSTVDEEDEALQLRDAAVSKHFVQVHNQCNKDVEQNRQLYF